MARSRVGRHRGEPRGCIPGPNGFSRLRALPGRARRDATRAPARTPWREAHIMEWGLRCILSKVFDSVALLGYMYQLARVSEERGGVKARPRGCGPAARGAAHGGPCRDQVSYAYDLLPRQKVAKDLEHGDEAATASFTALSWDILRAAKVRSASGGGRAGNAHRAARRRRESGSRTTRRRSPRAGARKAAMTSATRRAPARERPASADTRHGARGGEAKDPSEPCPPAFAQPAPRHLRQAQRQGERQGRQRRGSQGRGELVEQAREKGDLAVVKPGRRRSAC